MAVTAATAGLIAGGIVSGASAIGSGISGLINNKYNKEQNEWNKNFAREQFEYQKMANDRAFEYNKSLNQQIFDREDSAIQRGAADAKAAGLSKTLGIGQPAQASAGSGALGNSASSVSGGASSVSAPDVNALQDTGTLLANQAAQNYLYMSQASLNKKKEGTEESQKDLNIEKKDTEESIQLANKAQAEKAAAEAYGEKWNNMWNILNGTRNGQGLVKDLSDLVLSTGFNYERISNSEAWKKITQAFNIDPDKDVQKLFFEFFKKHLPKPAHEGKPDAGNFGNTGSGAIFNQYTSP